MNVRPPVETQKSWEILGLSEEIYNEKLARIISRSHVCTKTSEHCSNIRGEFLGDGTDKFKTLGELHKFLDVALKDATVQAEDITKLTSLTNALTRYEGKLISAITPNALATVLTEKQLKVTPELANFLMTSSNLSKGLDRLIQVNVKVARDINAKLIEDKETQEKRHELAAALIKVMIGCISTTAGDLFSTAVMRAAGDTSVKGKILGALSSSLASQPTTETPKEVYDFKAEQFVARMMEINQKGIPDDYTDIIEEIFQEVAVKARERDTKLVAEVSEKITSEGIQKQIEQLELLNIIHDLDYTKLHEQTFVETIAQNVAAKITANRQDKVNEHVASLTKMEQAAIEVAADPIKGAAHIEDISHELHRKYTARVLSSHYYYQEAKEKGYRDPKAGTEAKAITSPNPDFRPKIRDSTATVKHLPYDIAPLANFFEPTAAEKQMRIGGGALRHHLYETLELKHHKHFGYRAKGKYPVVKGKKTAKNRMRDTWRSIELISAIFGQNPPPPFPTLKEQEHLVKAILTIMHAEVFFIKHAGYTKTEEDPVISPLNVLMHLHDYRKLLNQEGIKNELKQFFTANPDFVLRLLTDINPILEEDKTRMSNALGNIHELLKLAGVPESALKKITDRASQYIELQFQYSNWQGEMKQVITLINQNDTFKTSPNKQNIQLALTTLEYESYDTFARDNAMKNLKLYFDAFTRQHPESTTVVNQYLSMIETAIAKGTKIVAGKDAFSELNALRKDAKLSPSFNVPTHEPHLSDTSKSKAHETHAHNANKQFGLFPTAPVAAGEQHHVAAKSQKKA